jgi:hypothetical protein
MPGKIVYLTAAAPNNSAAFFMLFNTKKIQERQPASPEVSERT